METVWVNPNPPGGILRKRDFIRVASELQPPSSPAPAGNPIVPTGYVLQMGDEGECDTMLADTRSGPLQYRANITQFVVPLWTGGWPPDPLSGQSGHTPITPP